jgi:hypothetical protein
MRCALASVAAPSSGALAGQISRDHLVVLLRHGYGTGGKGEGQRSKHSLWKAHLISSRL